MEDETDMEITMRFAMHIDNPCIDCITGKDIRGFYLKEAKELIKRLKDQNAIEFLEAKIIQYA